MSPSSSIPSPPTTQPAGTSRLPPQAPPDPTTELAFLQDLVALVSPPVGDARTQLDRIAALVKCRLRLREGLVAGRRKDRTRGEGEERVSIATLPTDILLTLHDHLPPSGVLALAATCRGLHSLYRAYTQGIWRRQMHHRFPSAAAARAVPVDWRIAFEERTNLEIGEYRFERHVEGVGAGGSRTRGWARRGRRVVLNCGQPTAAISGYAVNLRLTSTHLCWLSHTTIALHRPTSPTPTHLAGHTLPLTSLATNHATLIASSSEDSTVRIWDAPTNTCICVIEAADVLEVAMHERRVVGYSNANVVRVWDLDGDGGESAMEVDLADIVDSSVLGREVKVAVWGRWIVCGYEMCVWSIESGSLLYRLSESIGMMQTLSMYQHPKEVITDFTLDPTGTYLAATVESDDGQVYLLSWDFRAEGAKERWFEKRSLDAVAGEIEIEVG
ncbi:hypothetical protein BDK51DRAFT_33586, partial [Blyttiomyces helicus]